MHRRRRVCASIQFVSVSVTARASGGFGKTLRARASMNALRVRLHAVSMTGLALDRLQFGRMRNLSDVAVTGGAFKNPVNGWLEALLLDLERDCLSVLDLLHSLNAVAAEAHVFGNRLSPQKRGLQHRGKEKYVIKTTAVAQLHC